MLSRQVKNARIVLIEDDDVLQRQVVLALRGSFAGLDVHHAKDAAEALHLLEDQHSRLLITDAQSLELDGLAIATTARKLRPGLPVIVMTNPPCHTQREKSQLLAATWLEKPPQLEQLVGLVERMLVVQVGFTGELAIDGLPDLVQLLSGINTSGALHVEQADQQGCIWFEKGAIVHAILGDLNGGEAFHELVRWQGGVFALERNARAGRRTIEVSPMQLLLESVCLLDQDRAAASHQAAPRLKRSSAGVNRPSAASYVRLKGVEPTAVESSRDRWSTPQQQAAECFQRGLEHAQNKRYGDALRDWESAARLDPDNHVYQANLRRLSEVQRRSRHARGTDDDQE